MERSGSQKVLLVLSIIEIIGAILIIIAGLAGYMALAGAGISANTGDAELNSVVQGASSGIGFALFIITVIVGGWSLLCGIFGVRAANDNQKIMIVWVFLLIGMIIELIGAAMAILNGFMDTSFLSVCGALVWSVFMFWIANNIKKEAGK